MENSQRSDAQARFRAFLGEVPQNRGFAAVDRAIAVLTDAGFGPYCPHTLRDIVEAADDQVANYREELARADAIMKRAGF